MHVLFRLTLVGLLPIVLAGCVSRKKYDTAVFKLQETQQQHAQEKRALEEQIAAQTKRADNAEETVAELRAEIKRLKAEIDSLRNLNHQLVGRNQGLTDDLAAIRQQSSAEMRNLLNQLQDLRQDLYTRESRLRELERNLAARDSVLADLEGRLNQALLPFREKGLEVRVERGKVYVSLANRLLFDKGKTAIDAEGKKALAELASVLKQEPELGIIVEGHTDSLPVLRLAGIEDNWDLSALRATEVIRYLVTSGDLNPTRIRASGRSQYDPIASNETREGQARNRRIEVILTPNLTELYNLLDATSSPASALPTER